MRPALLLAIYSSVVVVGSLAGGYLPLVVRLTHRRMQIAISFVSGVILGIGILHLLPHGFLALGSIDATVLWLMGGFLFMFFLERFFEFHHHDVADDAPAVVPHQHEHHGEHAHEAHEPLAGHANAHHDHAHRHATSPISWASAAIGLSLHGLVDGIALAAAVQAESAASAAQWAGLGTALAIALHKPFDSLTVGTLLATAGEPRARRSWFNLGYALITPLGVLLWYFWSGGATHSEETLGRALAFAAGAFVCIATSDLLPELQFHRHDRTSLSFALLLGIALAWATGFLEPAGHDHEHHTHVEHREMEKASP